MVLIFRCCFVCRYLSYFAKNSGRHILEHDGSIIYIILQSSDSGTVGYVGAYLSIILVTIYNIISEGKKILWLLALNFFF